MIGEVLRKEENQGQGTDGKNCLVVLEDGNNSASQILGKRFFLPYKQVLCSAGQSFSAQKNNFRLIK